MAQYMQSKQRISDLDHLDVKLSLKTYFTCDVHLMNYEARDTDSFIKKNLKNK
jgi:hypothetical protein